VHERTCKGIERARKVLGYAGKVLTATPIIWDESPRFGDTLGVQSAVFLTPSDWQDREVFSFRTRLVRTKLTILF
jgi:hypothetical protein